MMKRSRMAAWTIVVVLVFALVTIFSTAGYAQTAKKAKKKSTADTTTTQASASDQGPTLEQTLEFIESKFSEFYADRYQDKHLPGRRADYYHVTNNIVFSAKGCSVKITYDEGTYHYESEFNLTDVSHVAVELYRKDLVESGEFSFLCGGKPLYDVVVKSSKKKLCSYVKNPDGSCCEKSCNYPSAGFPMKNQEYATRMAKAFERAAKLCGGGQDIGKKDLF